jgi:hypothetical protein
MTAQITKAIRRGQHSSALTSTAIAHFVNKLKQKVACSQAKLIRWRDIRNNPPAELKISPISAIPHKSKPYQSILDFHYAPERQNNRPLHEQIHGQDRTKRGRQSTRHLLWWIIHAFVEADDDAKIFILK